MNELLNKSRSTQAIGPIWKPWFNRVSIGSLVNHPFFSSVAEGAHPDIAIRVFLVQHQHYAKFFPRYVCAAMANLPEQEDVKAIAQNLWEELGVASANTETHGQLFLHSMRSLSVEPSSMPPLSGTRNLISAMFGFARSEDPIEGLSALCFGAEAIVPLMYSPILHAISAMNLPPRARLFFELHVEDDEDHALAMLAIIRRLIDGNACKQRRAREIGEIMIAHRVAFLDDVLLMFNYLIEHLPDASPLSE